ncbi:tetratricopeptide repeat protein [Flavobacteriaceae bacterium LMO-SS05]
MATYKKKGFKPDSKAERENAIEKQSKTAEVFNTLDETASKTEEWAIKNQKYIFVIVGLAAVIVLGYLGFKKFIAEPKADEAMNEMFTAQSYFDQAVNGTEKDSLYNLALHGGQGKFGMLDIVNEYSGTPAANLANYYAGMSYLNLRDYTNAITYLEDFSSDDIILSAIAKGGIGDAFAQLNQPKNALEYYEKAVAVSDNEFTAPMYLFKAGSIALELGEQAKALKYFNRIKDEFSASAEAVNIDVFIGKAEASL